jgi:surfactin synthase thioesterase subunit
MKFLKLSAVMIVLWGNALSAKAQDSKMHLYFLPGTGSSIALFDSMAFDSSYELHYIDYVPIDKGTTMNQYALQLTKQIDTTQKFVLIGTSLGGMIATEMADSIQPEQVFLIASAKTYHELPPRYKFQKKVPIQKLVGPNMIKWSTYVLGPIVDSDIRTNKRFFKAMLDEKDAIFMKRAVDMILQWDRTTYANSITHIHGDKDHTLPIRHINADYVIKNGTHAMTYTRAKEIQRIIENSLCQ